MIVNLSTVYSEHEIPTFVLPGQYNFEEEQSVEIDSNLYYELVEARNKVFKLEQIFMKLEEQELENRRAARKERVRLLLIERNNLKPAWINKKPE